MRSLSEFEDCSLKLRFDQTKVSILTLVEHSDAAGICIPEHDETVRLVGEFERRLLGSHWLHAVAARIDDSHGRGRGLHLAVRTWRGRGSSGRVMFAIDYFLFNLERLLLDLSDGAAQSHIHVGVRVGGGQRVVAPVNYDLARLPVLLDFQDDVHPRFGPVENVVQLFELLFDMTTNCRRDFDMTPSVFECHWDFGPPQTRSRDHS